MTKTTSPESQPPTRPTFVVETSLAETVTPKLDAWLDDLDKAIPRVVDDTDGEAVHDLRVAMRRIRSLLKVVRPVFGKFYVKIIRDEFKKVADATGALRDEEVLDETIEGLSLEPKHRKAIEPWLARRAERERQLRGDVVELLRSGALDAPRTHLRAVLRLPLPPGQDKEALKFARKIVFGAHTEVEALRTADVDDVVRMHDLRIAYKRLRYAVEALGPVLPPELRAWGQVATKFQKVLGNLHDHDVALDVVRDAKTLSEGTRAALREALLVKRAHYAKQYLDLVGLGVVTPTEPEDKKEPEKPERDEQPKAPTPPKKQAAKKTAKKTVKKTPKKAAKGTAAAAPKTPTRRRSLAKKGAATK